MSTQVQRRKGTTAQHASFTGASAELTVDTTKNTVVVHDGVTAGGIPLAKETGSAISVTSFTSSGAASIETTDNTNAALRITQLGTGNALLVEDSASPDSSPVVITNNGTLVVGNTARVTSTSLIEAHSSAAVSGAPAIANYSWGTLATGGAFNLYKSRSGTVGTQALVASGTQSSVRFYFDDGVAFQQGASIIGAAEGTPALNSMPGRLTFNTSADGSVTPTERMRIDSAGNLGLGVTPSAWGGAYKVIQGYVGAFALSADGSSNNQMRLSSNAYNNGTNWIYYASSNATSYEQRVGEHRWYNAPSGTANAAITFTQAMTLDASGRLIVGGTTASGSSATFNGGQASVVIAQPSSTSYGGLRIYNDINTGARALEIDYSGSGFSGPLLTGGPSGESASIGTTGTFPLVLGTNNTARITITAAGNQINSGTISPQQATTASAPAYVKGAMYFDTTLNKLRIGGATGWETVTSA